jgi:hypothetical protein
MDSDTSLRTQSSVCEDTATLSRLAASDMLRELAGSSSWLSFKSKVLRLKPSPDEA